GGLAAYVYQADGTYYYMAHLSAFVAGQRPGQHVRQGEIVGYVGDSGNAKGGSPHVHVEIHPAPSRQVVSGAGRNRTVTYVTRPVPIGTVLPAMDPKAVLDQWLREALEAVPELIAEVELRPRALLATGLTRRLPDGASGVFAAPVAPPRSQLLWASSVNPGGGAARLAEAEAMVAASELDWATVSRRQQAQLEEQAEALAWAQAVVAPLTPDALIPPEAADE
ncbi:MAG: M23 family metallopeptidase, partial [Acidimicrobiales bacterium]